MPRPGFVALLVVCELLLRASRPCLSIKTVVGQDPIVVVRTAHAGAGVGSPGSRKRTSTKPAGSATVTSPPTQRVRRGAKQLWRGLKELAGPASAVGRRRERLQLEKEQKLLRWKQREERLQLQRRPKRAELETRPSAPKRSSRRSVDRPPGFANGGNTCFIAAVLQVLLNTPPLMAALTDAQNLADRDDNPGGIALIFLLLEIKADYTSGAFFSMERTAQFRRRLHEEVGLELASGRGQEDAGDFFMDLLSKFDPAKVPGIARSVTIESGRCDASTSRSLRKRDLAPPARPAEGAKPEEAAGAPGSSADSVGEEEETWYSLPDGRCGRLAFGDPALDDMVFLHADKSVFDTMLEAHVMQHDKFNGNDIAELNDESDFGSWRPCDTGGPSFHQEPRSGVFCRGGETREVEVKRVWYEGRPLVVYRWTSQTSTVYLSGQEIAILRAAGRITFDAEGFVELPVASPGGGASGLLGAPRRTRFRLSSCIRYLGDSERGVSGHYVAIASRAQEDKWYRFDDARVRAISLRAAIEECSADTQLLIFKRPKPALPSDSAVAA